MKKIHIDETLFEETPIEDLQQLARALLEDPKTGPVIRRSGVHGDFTQEEELAIKALIETHGKTQGWGVRDPVLLPLSVTLARQVADGVIESTDCIKAYEYLEDRYLKRAGDRHGFRSKKPFPSEILLVAKDLMADQKFWRAMQEVGVSKNFDDDYWHKVLRPIQDKIILKYGLQNRGPISAISLLRRVAVGQIRDLDDPDALAFVSRNKMFIREEN